MTTLVRAGWAIIVAGSVSAAEWPDAHWKTATPSEMGLDGAKLAQARGYALTADGSGYVIYKGKLVMSWGDPAQRYDLKSSSKSIGGTLLGIALKDDRVPADIVWRKNAFRPHLLHGIPRREFGSGFSANVNAMARLGYLYLREGRWKDDQLLPPEFIQAIRKPDPALARLPSHANDSHGQAASHYSMLWWNNLDGTIKRLTRDAHWSWGLYDSLIVVIPSLDIVVARAWLFGATRYPGARSVNQRDRTARNSIRFVWPICTRPRMAAGVNAGTALVVSLVRLAEATPV
jgi:hypothetical protein